MRSKRLQGSVKLITRIAWLTVGAWTLLLAFSLWWTRQVERNQQDNLVTNVARAYIDKDLAFRLWGSSHGGVYVPVSAKTQPNPYLRQIPERDLVSPAGKQLTLLNPAYMMREVLATFSELTGVAGHLTSLKPINAINTPDEWERMVLSSFEQGVKERFAFVVENGESYLRYMRPFLTQEPCLKCHAAQGYKIGDIRGATSIKIPLAPYQAGQKAAERALALAHAIIWLVGILSILFTASRLRRNITAALAMEEDLRDKNQRINTIIESLTYPFAVIDANSYQVVLANSAAIGTQGDKASTCFALGHQRQTPCAGDQHPCPLARIRSEKKSLCVEHCHPDGQGGFRLVELHAFPVFDQEGEVRQIIEYMIDITERRQGEKERLALVEQLQQAQKMEAIGTLAGGIAHDFNNILTGIGGYAQLAHMEELEAAARHKYVGEILRGVTRARELVKQILTFSRKGRQEKAPLQLSAIVKETSKLLRASIPATIELRLQLQSEAAIAADPTQMHQVLMNLCTNAYFAMREEGGVLTIALAEVTVAAEPPPRPPQPPPGAYLRLTVADTGHGMSEAVQGKIFQPYFTTKELGEGTGLGLSVVHGIVRDHQGSIELRSTPGQGTTFHVYFPLLARESPEAPDAANPVPVVGGCEKILFVDDEEIIVDFAQEFLTWHGYRVTTCVSPAQALTLFQKDPEQFDLAITDMTMPLMTGLQLFTQFRLLNPTLPVIVCTGHSDFLDREKALALGIADYLEKPLAGEELLAAMRRILDQPRPPA